MKNIIEENYKSIVARGLITPSTLRQSFVDKLQEEVKEFTDVFNDTMMIDKEELSDVILVCLNIAKHYNIDIETELKNKIQVNYERAK